MKIFICYRSIDEINGKKTIEELVKASDNSIAVLTETKHSENWKKRVEKKIYESDFVGFLLGENTFKSPQIKWEYAKAKELNKRIFGIKLKNVSQQSILFCQGFQVFDNPKQSIKFLEKTFFNDRLLKIEQYKIMVNSTEKVTEQRMKVNNLFFTVSASILSIAFVVGKSNNFNIPSLIAMLLLTSLISLSSFYWKNLVKSYGKLNTGKFEMINQIEKRLRTNLFENEWSILTNKIKYKPNTRTEKGLIIGFMIFTFVLLGAEIIFLIIQFKCNS